MKNGETYAEAGDAKNAAQCFAYVGEHFANDGFFLKAIAMFKRVMRLDPSANTDLRLGELHAKLQLPDEAEMYFKRAEAEFIQLGDFHGADAARQRLAELKK